MYQYTPPLTNGCRIGNNDPLNDNHQAQRFAAQREYEMNDNLRLDLARLEAKIDVLINMRVQGHDNAPAKAQSLNLAEVSLLRNLTIKQHAVSQLVLRGWKNKDIAAVMGVTDNTIKLHVAAVAKKMGVKTRGQVAVALRPIIERVPPEEYKGLSGGIPVDWGDTIKEGTADSLAPLYAPQRGAKTWD